VVFLALANASLTDIIEGSYLPNDNLYKDFLNNIYCTAPGVELVFLAMTIFVFISEMIFILWRRRWRDSVGDALGSPL
jgi:hypothetical protein